MLVLALQFSKGNAQGRPHDVAVRPDAVGSGPGAGVLDRSCRALKDESLKTEEKIKHCHGPVMEDKSCHIKNTSTEPTSAPTGILSRPGERMFTNARENLLRKEVIQPHLPVRLPCYDLVPIASPTFDSSLPQGVRPPASGVTNFRDLTGGVYKARERIHRSVADLRLLATPTS